MVLYRRNFGGSVVHVSAVIAGIGDIGIHFRKSPDGSQSVTEIEVAESVPVVGPVDE